MAKVVVVGSINMDLVTRAAAIPKPGETIIGGDLQTFPGGKGANQAVAAARLGAQVTMVGRVGDDAFGNQMRATLENDGIDTQFVIETAETPTGVALIVVDEQGQNSIVVAPGANGRLTAEDVENAAQAIREADILLLQLEVPQDAVLRAAQLAAAHDVCVVLNPAPAAYLPRELLELVDILIPNETETEILSSLPVSSAAELETAAQSLLNQGVKTVILTLGERGALLTHDDQTILVPAFRIEKVVDTTAAGDAFVGGFSAAIGEGLSLPEAVRWGAAAGAVAVSRTGAQPSLPTRDEVACILPLENDDP